METRIYLEGMETLPESCTKCTIRRGCYLSGHDFANTNRSKKCPLKVKLLTAKELEQKRLIDYIYSLTADARITNRVHKIRRAINVYDHEQELPREIKLNIRHVVNLIKDNNEKSLQKSINILEKYRNL